MSIYINLIKQPRTKLRYIRQSDKKSIGAEVKTSLQPLFKMREINSRYPKNQDNVNREY